MPKISALPAAASVNLTDILPEVSPASGGTTYKATFQQVYNAFALGGAALTRTNDTNVTLTLGGSPATALLNASSITAGWSGQLAVGRGGTGVASVTTAPTATSFAGWDANSNLSANNFIEGYATTVTAAATTTLTVASKNLQYFTGSTTQTVVLPVTSTLVLGQQFQITNLSSGNVTVQSSGLNNIQVMAANTKLIVTCILTSGTSAASWDASYTTEAGGTVTSVALSVPSVLSISGSPITSSGTLAIGYSGTALPILNGGTGSTTATGSGSVVLATTPTISQPVINGVTDGSAAGAGVVGQIISANASTVSVTSGATPNIATITLSAGDWDVWGQLEFLPASTTAITALGASVSATSGGFDSGISNAVSYTISRGIAFTGTGAATIALQSGEASISVNTNTTFYLSAFSLFTVSTMTATGKIQARRRR
jgi:hypothetical protein